MNSLYSSLIGDRKLRWTVTGVAGFIGSHLAEALLRTGQDVTGLDDYSTGLRSNVELLSGIAEQCGKFRFVEGSVENSAACAAVCKDADIILHQAALGSIPRSIEDPVRTHAVNAAGTFTMLTAARDAGVKRFVYASSSSVYGDDRELPKVEDRIGAPLAPYSASKQEAERLARGFADIHGLETLGLRYFNVFGPRQDPNGAYAAVIPRWIRSLARGEETTIYGDGSTSRDFCFIANVVQANLRAALYTEYDVTRSVFNIAVGGRTTLAQLHEQIAAVLLESGINHASPPARGPERIGDVRHSQADISRANAILGYAPTHDLQAGLRETVQAYIARSED